jgi:glycerate kinase
MPRIVVAPDKFKGSCTAREAGNAIVAGLHAVWGDAAEYALLPLADGGEGTVAAFLENGAIPIAVRVHDARGAPVDAVYARLGTTAIVEMASASGLAQLGKRLDARRASTFGTGEVIAHALGAGAARIVLGIGGSATTDGGAGALAALGVRFFDAAGAPLEPIPVALEALAQIDVAGLDPRLAHTQIDIACDVANVLLGPRGAAAVYGPQKGATPADVAFLDRVLARIASAATALTGRDLRMLPGAGAAGGLGWGLASFTPARLSGGFAIVAELAGLNAALHGATLCFTGEGRIDAQSLAGKVVAGVAGAATEAGVPVIAIGGSVDPDAAEALRERGVECIALATDDGERARAIREPAAFIRAAVERWARCRAPA